MTRRRGGGYQTSQQFFDPTVLPPHTRMPTALTTAATPDAIRPVLVSTFKGGRRTRRSRGGFYPSVMGSFIANAQSVIAPAAMLTAYRSRPSVLGGSKKRRGRK